MKIHILKYKYYDGSSYKNVRVFTEDQKHIAKDILDILLNHTSSDKEWMLEEVDVFVDPAKEGGDKTSIKVISNENIK